MPNCLSMMLAKIGYIYRSQLKQEAMNPNEVYRSRSFIQIRDSLQQIHYGANRPKIALAIFFSNRLEEVKNNNT